MKKIGFIAGISFLAGAIFFALSFGYFQDSANNRIALKPDAARAESMDTLEAPEPANIKAMPGFTFAPLVKKVRAAVVKVNSEAIVERRSIFDDDLLDRFFGFRDRRGRRQRVTGTGSGFFISPDGYILTNYHVVKDAIKIKIKDINEKTYTARKVGVDPKTDLALLKVKLDNQPYIELGDSDKLEVGEWVLAIGNPLGQDLSVTSGIVSAKGRKLEGLEVDYQNFIQTDAAINQGNSGGPLVNMEGRAIGITSVILSTSGGNIGIGFAIPSNMARKVIRDLKKEGRVVRGYIGVQIMEVPDEDAEQFDLAKGGIMIWKVEEDTPAKQAGLKKFDVIVEINGKKVKSSRDLQASIANHNPGDTIRLTIYRGKEKKIIHVKIAEAPDSVKIRSDDEDARVIDLGMVLKNNSRALARQYDLSTSEGVVIVEIERGGVAYQHNLRVGDIIVGINRTVIESIGQFREIMSRKSGSTVLLSVVRGDRENLVRFKVPR
ncbi:MAG: Do family serine endopeptidase [Candidatus Aminicenantes bacterium]|nr:Do family serine endopeptidase [Candidatus Aminicenantes bacterium]NIM81370.1 Do family serine endopeptidase [Candidatus Aminicenantes bacterium]NIN20781.1 Do family serine endopeptidase [Candidatus Aminicenantes bacterium]NIN44559.1 Do family serine endopeptidase [Candidatus Aminicenantes bacterium]NIN87379.1 Do family serine endopeptidase [Candidatus Aminicenantes bacterium]